MVNNNIWLGAGTTVTMVPETDLYVPVGASQTGQATGTGHLWQTTADSDFTDDFTLVDDLYVGCMADVYNAKNTGTIIYFNVNPSIAATDYLVIRKYGTPIPGDKGTSTGILATATITDGGNDCLANQAVVLNAAITGGGITSTGAELLLGLSSASTPVTFAAESGTNYDTGYLVIYLANSGGDRTLAVAFNCSAGTTHPATGFDEYVEVNVADSTSAENMAIAVQTALANSSVSTSRVGAVLTITNDTGGYVNSGTHMTKNTTASAGTLGGVTLGTDTDGGVVTSVSITNAGSNVSGSKTLTITSAAGDNATIDLTSTTTGGARLFADNWLGLVNTVSFPNSEVEMKQMNLGVGGSRNWTHQYKGIETAQGGNIDISANHGLWLYYALGECLTISPTRTGGITPSDRFTTAANKYLYHSESIEKTGPVFYRSIGTKMIPPISPLDVGTLSEMDEATLPDMNAGSIRNGITYTFGESNGSTLPSFALESVYSKLSATNPYKTTQSSPTADDEAFVRIATGNMVNTLTMSANENEELKMTLDLNTKGIFQPNSGYEARRGISNERDFLGFGSAGGGATASESEFLTPFFFYDGTISAYGNDYLKITNMTLTINNNLQDKRYVGGYDRKNKYAVAAQRTYELSLTGYVTDSQVFEDLRNEAENNSTTNYITLLFQKDNGEKIELKFKDYYTTVNNWPVPDDKGAVPVEWTIIPRTLQSCSVVTHAVLNG